MERVQGGVTTASLPRDVWHDLRRTWPQLFAVYLAADLAIALVAAPVIALVLGLFVAASGGPALTDEDIAHFLLRPLGLAALLVVGALVLAIRFARLMALMAIGYAAAHDRRLTWWDALVLVFGRAGPLVMLCGRFFVRLLLVAVPFLLAAAAVWRALLGEFDINYYLSVRPPEATLAFGLGLALIACYATIAAALIVSWIFGLPLLLFGGVGPLEALAASARATRGKRRMLAAWLIGVLAATSLVATVASALLAIAGALIVPDDATSLTLVAAAVGIVLALQVAGRFLVLGLGRSLWALTVVRLYVRQDGPGEPPGEDRLGRRARVKLPRRRWLAAGIAGTAIATTAALGVVGSIDTRDAAAITGHRGAPAHAPENTLASIRRAIADGADWVEVDVQRTADGVVVVAHDRDLMKIGGSPLRIAQATFAELREVDIGSAFGAEFAGERILTLDEALGACGAGGRLTIELKYYGNDAGLAPAVVEAVEAAGMADRVALMSLRPDAVSQVRGLRPGWRVGLLAAVSVGDLTRIDADFLALSARHVSGTLVRRARRAGKEVHAWTVNEPLQMSALVSAGVDNLITDDPGLARRVLAQRAGLNTVERLLVDLAGKADRLEAALFDEDEAPAERP